MPIATGTAEAPANVNDLHSVEGRAELIAGKIVRYPHTGYLHGKIRGNIRLSLHKYSETTGYGEDFGRTIAFVVPRLRSGRETFSPDVSWSAGPFPENPMAFMEGPPAFAVEIISEEDYGKDAEKVIAARRGEYFEAGTRIVWDLNMFTEVIRSWRADFPDQPTVFRRGDVAHAEPVVPGWSMPVDEMFDVD